MQLMSLNFIIIFILLAKKGIFYLKIKMKDELKKANIKMKLKSNLKELN